MIFEAFLLVAFSLFAFTLVEFWRAPLGWQDNDGFHCGLPEMCSLADRECPSARYHTPVYFRFDGRRFTLINFAQRGGHSVNERADLDA